MIERDATNPCRCVARDGRIGVFIGGGYKYMPIEVAEKFRDELSVAIIKAKESA